MILSLSNGPRTLLNDCNRSATAMFWRSAIRTAAAYINKYSRTVHWPGRLII